MHQEGIMIFATSKSLIGEELRRGSRLLFKSYQYFPLRSLTGRGREAMAASFNGTKRGVHVRADSSYLDGGGDKVSQKQPSSSPSAF